METPNFDKMYVSYEDLQKKCVLLAEQIEKSGYKPDMIVSITRGGLLSAYFLADLLGVRAIETINVSSRSGTDCVEIKDLTKFPKDFTNFNALIVDDLVDSGRTMKYILDKYTFNPLGVKIATIYFKHSAVIKPDYFIEEVADDSWIVFPYER